MTITINPVCVPTTAVKVGRVTTSNLDDYTYEQAKANGIVFLEVWEAFQAEQGE